MSQFSRRPLNPSPILSRIRARPFLFFGGPFLFIVIGSSFAMQTFTQTRYDLHNSKHKQLSFEQEMGLTGQRKKLDLREEYFRLSNPDSSGQIDIAALSTGSSPPTPSNPPSAASSSSSPAWATSSDGWNRDDDSAASRPKNKAKRKRLSMIPVTQDEFENIRVPRPAGMPEWGAPPEDVSEDAPIKGQRKEDRWV